MSGKYNYGMSSRMDYSRFAMHLFAKGWTLNVIMHWSLFNVTMSCFLSFIVGRPYVVLN